MRQAEMAAAEEQRLAELELLNPKRKWSLGLLKQQLSASEYKEKGPDRDGKFHRREN